MVEPFDNEPGPERVLVIDDDENYCTVVRRSLTRKGYEVFAAASGAEGLTLAVQHQPKVVILDLRMPGMDGHTFLRRFRELNLRSAVVVSSGAGEMDDVIEVMRQGAVDYLKKPWAPSELLAAVARAAERVDALSGASGVAVVGGAATASAEGAVAAPAAKAPTATPLPKAATAAPVASPSAFTHVLEAIQQGLHIPTVPTVVAELRRRLADPAVTVPEIVELVATDQWLSAEVLRLARSVLHGGRWHGLDLGAAVTRIGLKEVLTLTETAFAGRCFSVEDSELMPILEEIWRFSVARAVFMRALAPCVAVARVQADRAYVAGLFADIGASFLMKVIAEMKRAKGAQITVPEVLAFVRSHHAQAGAAVLRGWGLDASVENLSRHHHGTGPAEPLRELCRLASMLVLEQSLATDVTAAEAPAATGPNQEALVLLKRALKVNEAAFDNACRQGAAAVAELAALVHR